MENKIEIRNMNLHYGDFHALHDINLDIKENEITAFIGPSGCGKVYAAAFAQPHERSGGKLPYHGRYYARRAGYFTKTAM